MQAEIEKSRKRRKIYVALGVGLVVLPFVVLESVACLFLNYKNRASIEFDRKKIYDFSGERFAFKPNARASHIYRMEGKIVHQVTYSINEQGWRRTVKGEGIRNEHLQLWGCSNIFGEGLSDEETLASVLEDMSDRYRVYNFGVPGTSIDFSLVALRQLKKNIVAPSKGKAVYFFFGYHYLRILPSLMQYRGNRSPSFYFDPHDQLIERDSNSFYMNIFSFFSGIAKMSSFMKAIHFDWPQVEEETVTLTARLLDSFRSEYLRQFPQGSFFVVVDHRSFSQYRYLFLKKLSNLKIKYIDITDSMEFEGVMTPVESHPSLADNHHLAKILMEHLL